MGNSKTEKCCRCDTATQPHSDNTIVIEREEQACRCMPCFICIASNFYGTIGDVVSIVPFTKSSQFSKPSGYFLSLVSGLRTIDIKIKMEKDAYDDCVLVLTSEEFGYTLTSYDDTRLKWYFGPYDEPCRLKTQEDIIFYIDDYELGEGTITVSRGGFLDSPMVNAICGPTSNPYECFCGRAVVTRESWDYEGNSVFERIPVCYEAFPYPSTKSGWKVNFLDDLNNVEIWRESGGPSDPDNPLVFGLTAPDYIPEILIPPESPLRDVECVTAYNPTASMDAEWMVTGYSQEPYKISIRADSHFHKYHCCKCWVDCLCISVTTDNATGCIGRGTVCMSPYDPYDPYDPRRDIPYRIWEYSVACGDGYPITGTISLICSCEDLGPHLVFDGDYENSIPVECPLFTMPGFPNLPISYTRIDGTTITIKGSPCGLRCISEDWPCCPGTEFKEVIYLTLFSMNALCSCIHGQVIPMLLVNEIDGRVYYKAIWRMPCVVEFQRPEIVRTYTFSTDCAAGGASPFGVITIRYTQSDSPGINFGPWTYDAISSYESPCDPLYLRYRANGDGQGAWVRCEDDVQDPTDVEMELTS